MTSVVSIFSSQDEDIKVFREATKTSRAGLAAWKRISAYKKDNDTSLADEMEVTAAEIEMFIVSLENDLRIKKFRRESLGSDVYVPCKNICTDITAKIELGVHVMERVVDILGLRNKKDPTKDELSLQSSKQSVSETLSMDSERLKAKERIEKLGEKMKNLMARFARILDEEGVPHKYPVPKLPPKPLKIPAYEVREPKEFIASKEVAKKKDSKEIKRTVSQSLSRTSKTRVKGEIGNVRSPVHFLEEYALQADLNVELTQVRATRTAWYLEYIFSCKIFNIVGEGRGKSKEYAKQEAASQVITNIISKQKRGILPPEMPPLTAKQMDFGNSLLCEAIDYEEELIEICAKENHRPPIFTTVTKGPTVAVRCNALAVSAVGRARSRDMARRMAAKNIIEVVMEERRRNKEALKSGRTEILSP